MPDTARKLIGIGLTDHEVAQFFEINPSTLYRWKHDHPDFCDALTRAKVLADDVVEQSLFRRAVGYSYDAVKIFMPKDATTPVYAPYVEHVPPDPSSAKLWLTNRRPKEWREQTVVTVEPAEFTELEIAQRIAALLVAGVKHPALTVIEGDKT